MDCLGWSSTTNHQESIIDRRSKLPGSGHRRCWSSCNVETLTMKRLTDRNEWSTVKSHREVSNRRLTLQADSYSSPNSHIFYGTWSSSIFDRFFFSSGGSINHNYNLQKILVEDQWKKKELQVPLTEGQVFTHQSL